VTDWNEEGGGHQAIYRGTATGTTTMASAYSGAVDIRQFNSLSFAVVGTAWTGGTMAWQAAHLSTEGTFYPVCGTGGALVRVPISHGTLYAAPSSVSAQHFVKFWSENGSGGTVAQADSRTIRYYLKG